MISLTLARELRRLGVRWQPAPGDRFLVDEPEMVDSVFWVSDFTIEAHQYAGESVLGFNGTTEWALDSVAVDACLWLPREDQLRELLGSLLLRLERVDDGWRVVTRVSGGADLITVANDAETAYAQALGSALD